MMEIKDEIKDAQQLFEVKSNLVSSIMNNILLLSSMSKNSEATRYQAQLSRLIQEGEVYDLNNLLRATEKTLDMYR